MRAASYTVGNSSKRVYVDLGGSSLGNISNLEGFPSHAYSVYDGYATATKTFTPYMYYRTSPLAAPLAVMVPVQGNTAGTAGDVLSYGRGTQVSGNNYDCANPNQGSFICLFEVPWAGNDGTLHVLRTGLGVRIVKTAASQIQVTLPDGSTTITTTGATVAGWARGSRHLCIVRWDADNVVSGSAYADLYLDNTQTTGPTSALTPTAPSATNYIGSESDGSYSLAGMGKLFGVGVEYVLSSTELTALWNSGSFADPARVLARPDALKTYWNPGARAASGAFTGTVTAEAAFVNHRAYNVSTNPAGDLLGGNGMCETDAHIAAWTASNAVLERVGRARNLSGSAQWFYRASEAALQAGDIDFGISFYLYLPQIFGGNANTDLIGKWGAAAGQSEYVIAGVRGSAVVRFVVTNDGTTVSGAVESGSLTLNAWNHIIAWHNASANTLNIRINDALTYSASHSAGVYAGTGVFSVGRGERDGTYAVARIARVGFWKKVLSAGEITALYNSGKGLYYAELAATAGLTTGLVGYWNLNEESGNALDDSGAGLTLTASGAPTDAAGPDVADLAGFFDTGAGKLIATTAADGEAYRDVALAEGTSVYVSGFGLEGSADNGAQLRVYSGTSGSEETTLLLDTSETADAVTKLSGCVAVQTGHDRLRFKLTTDTGTAGTSSLWDNVRVWKNLAVNGGMEGTYAKTGSAITTSTAATSTVTDLGSGSYRVTDGTAWDLSLAVAGMIAEWHDGSGFITTVTDASDLIELNGVTGNPPSNGDAVAVYSALAPGMAATGSPRLFRTTGRTGSYAQGVIGASANDGITQSVTVANATWHLLAAQINSTSGTARVQTTSGAAANLTDTTAATGAFELVSGIVRTSATTLVVQAVSATAGTFAVDDLACLPLSPIDFTATPASEANSQDTLGFNVDGGDINKYLVSSGFNYAEGAIVFKVRPGGWSGADSRLHTLFDTDVSGSSRLTVSKTAANALDITITDAAAGTKSRRLTVTNTTFANGTTYTIGVSWNSSGTLIGVLGTTAFDTDNGAGTGIMGGVGTYYYVGCSKDGTTQFDSQQIKCIVSSTAKSYEELMDDCSRL